jgi:hypothetical protein
MPPTISKSKYLSGLQCPKLLWHLIKAPATVPEPDAATEAIFDQGHEVGVMAQSLFPGGVSVPGDAAISERIAMTRKALSTRVPIYEATISAAGMYAQIDILAPAPEGRWDIHEVKSSTSVKDVNLCDVAFQRRVCEAAGLTIRRCHVVHLNNEYVRQGKIDIAGLFASEDVTDELASEYHRVPEELARMRTVLAKRKSPGVAIGPHCSDPYDCPMTEFCWAFLPERNVLDLYRGGRKSWDLLNAGVQAMAKIPESFPLTDKQTIQVQCARTGKPHLNAKGVDGFLRGLNYPLSLLDFETFALAIPPYDGTKPYQQIPFQFSLHTVAKPGAKPTHSSWLAKGRDDPRPGFLVALKDVLGTAGDIVTYNMSFEKARLGELAAAFPKHKGWIGRATARLVDLIEPFRSFSYHHPDQGGSASLKAVLPALTGRSYEGMEISEGEAAAREFLRVEHGEVAEKERQRVRRSLERYCGTDTMAMVWILEALRELAG